MNITNVRIKLADNIEKPNDRLLAFGKIIIDSDLVIQDLRVIAGQECPFISMPSRKIKMACEYCGSKNPLLAHYCNNCGAKLPNRVVPKNQLGYAKLYCDVAYPINSTCRDHIQRIVIDQFYAERERAKDPTYVSNYYDTDSNY